MVAKAIEIQACFKHRFKNTYITVAADDISQARRIARIWGEKEEGERVTRTIFRRTVSVPDGKPEIVDGIEVWQAPF